MKECPKCGLINPDSSNRCDCGFELGNKPIESHNVKPPFSSEQNLTLKNISVIFDLFLVLTLVGAIMSIMIVMRIENEIFKQFRIYFILFPIIGGIIGVVIFFSISIMAEIVRDINEKIEGIEKSINKKEDARDDNFRSS